METGTHSLMEIYMEKKTSFYSCIFSHKKGFLVWEKVICTGARDLTYLNKATIGFSLPPSFVKVVTA